MVTLHPSGPSLDSLLTAVLLALLFLVGFAMSVLAPVMIYTAAMRLP